MAEETHEYSVSADMPNGKVSISALHEEILASSITTPLVGVTRDGDALRITFESALTTEEKTTLDGDTTNPAGGLLAAHDSSREVVPLGSRLSYVNLSVPVVDEVQYVRVDAPPKTIKAVRVWMHTKGVTDPTVKVGLYDDVGGEPGNLLAQDSAVLGSLNAGQVADVVFASPPTLSVPQSVWVAFLADVDDSEFVSTGPLVSSFHDVRFEATADGNLPSSPSPSPSTGTVMFSALVV